MGVFFDVLHFVSVRIYVNFLGSVGPQASPTWRSYVTNIAPTATSHTVTGLRPAHSYQFQVSAVNAVGKGEASRPSRVVTLPEQRKCHILLYRVSQKSSPVRLVLL